MFDSSNPFEHPAKPSPDAIFYVPPVDLSRPDTHEPTSPGYPDVVLIPPDDRGANVTPEGTSAPNQPGLPEKALGILGIDGANKIHRDRDPDDIPNNDSKPAATTGASTPQEETPPPPTDNSGGGNDKPPQGPDDLPLPSPDEPPEKGEPASGAVPEGTLPVVTPETFQRVFHGEVMRDPEMLADVLERLQTEQPELIEGVTAFIESQATTEGEYVKMGQAFALAYRLLEAQAAAAEPKVDAPTGSSRAVPVIGETAEVGVGESEAPDTEAPTGPFLGFRQPFDGTRKEIPSREQQEAGRVFVEGIESFLERNNPGKIKYNPDRVQFDVRDEGRFIDVIVEKKDLAVYVHLEDAPPDAIQGEAVEYRIELGGEVRRIDIAVPTEEEQSLQLLDEQHARRLPLDATAEQVENAQYEEAWHSMNKTNARKTEALLGINNLPVGVEEVTKLLHFLNSKRRFPA